MVLPADRVFLVPFCGPCKAKPQRAQRKKMRLQRNAEHRSSPFSARSSLASVTSAVRSFLIRNTESSPFLMSEEIAHDR